MKKFILAAILACLVTTSSFAQTGARQIQSSDVTGALGYTPLQSIGGMIGPAVICGSGLLCTSNTISVLAAGSFGQIQVNSAGVLAGMTMTGDATIDTTSGVLTLATVNSNVGTWGSSTLCSAFNVNAKGLITAAAQSTCAPAIGSITGLGTGVSTALAANVGITGAFVVNGGALGTPSSGIATNLTGTATGLTAGSFSAGSASNLTSGTLPPARTNGHMNGTATNDSAAAGEVGEIISATVLIGSAVAQVSGSPANLTSISLTAGDWDVSGGVNFNPAATTSITRFGGCVETTTGAFSSDPANCYILHGAAFVPGASAVFGGPTPTRRISISGTTTIYLTTVSVFTTSTLGAYGTIRARRVR